MNARNENSDSEKQPRLPIPIPSPSGDGRHFRTDHPCLPVPVRVLRRPCTRRGAVARPCTRREGRLSPHGPGPVPPSQQSREHQPPLGAVQSREEALLHSRDRKPGEDVVAGRAPRHRAPEEHHQAAHWARRTDAGALLQKRPRTASNALPALSLSSSSRSRTRGRILPTRRRTPRKNPNFF